MIYVGHCEKALCVVNEEDLEGDSPENYFAGRGCDVVIQSEEDELVGVLLHAREKYGLFVRALDSKKGGPEDLLVKWRNGRNLRREG